MKVLSVAYDRDTEFILDIVKEFESSCIISTFSNSKRKEQKSVRGIQTALGTKSLPLIAIEDENFELVGAIWPENNPDWKTEINNKLKNL